MKPRLQLRIQRYGWDKAAEHYEPFWAKQLEPAQQLLMEMADLVPGERVVDVACGTGLVSISAAEAVGEEGRVEATDLSAEMVAATRARAAERGLSRISTQRMSADDLTFADDSFTVALCGLGLMYVPDPVGALKEMYRVLEPGGRAISSVWGERAACGWAEIFPIVDSRVRSEVCPMFFQLGTGQAQQMAFVAAGFDQVETQRIRTTLSYATESEALGAAFSGGPVALAYARFEDAVRKQAHDEYLASIEPYRQNGGYEIPGEFVVTRGHKISG